MPTTEIVTLTLKPGTDIGDPNSDASRVVNECGNVLAKQPGLQKVQFGPVVERPDQMQMFIDWDSLQSHRDFEASEVYGPFLEKFASLMAAPPVFMHVDFEGELAGPFKAPVTEVATFYFNDLPENFTEGVHDFIAMCVKERPETDFHGYATGSTYEIMEKDGVKGRAGVLIVGWDSIEQHQSFRQMPTFQQNADMMRQNAGAIEVHHATVMNFVAS